MKWDSNWDRLRIETKVEKLRDEINRFEHKHETEISSARGAADTALYVANLDR